MSVLFIICLVFVCGIQQLVNLIFSLLCTIVKTVLICHQSFLLSRFLLSSPWKKSHIQCLC